MNSNPRLLKVPEETVATTCDTAVEYDAGAYIAITLLSVIVFLVIVGTLWDPVAILVCSIQSAGDRKVLVNAECLQNDGDVQDANEDILPTSNILPKNNSIIGKAA